MFIKMNIFTKISLKELGPSLLPKCPPFCNVWSRFCNFWSTFITFRQVQKRLVNFCNIWSTFYDLASEHWILVFYNVVNLKYRNLSPKRIEIPIYRGKHNHDLSWETPNIAVCHRKHQISRYCAHRANYLPMVQFKVSL